MAINNKFVHFKTSAKFKEQLEAGNIKDTSVCFIKDTNQIYTHGQYYDCSELTDEKVVGSSLVGYAESQETNEALDLSSSDTIISAFGKLVKAIKDNEEVESAAFVKLRDSIGLDENLNYETGGGSSISEDISDLKNSVGSLNDNSVGKFYHVDDTTTGEIFNDYENNIAGNNAHAEGIRCSANGISAHAEGFNTRADGDYSHTEGYGTNANSRSHAEGSACRADGLAAHAEGNICVASGNNAHAEGNQTGAAGDSSHSEGKQTKANGESSHSEGEGCEANGKCTHVEGYKNITAGIYSHGEGYQNTITENGNASHAEGRENNISSMFAHAEGMSNTVSGDGAHAEGQDNIVSGQASHVEGASNEIIGSGSHAEGKYNIVSGDLSHAEGNYNIIKSICSHSEMCDFTNIYLTGDAGSVKYEILSDTSWLCRKLTQKELYDYFNCTDFRVVDTSTSPYTFTNIVSVEYDSNQDKTYITLEKTLSSNEAINEKKFGIARSIIASYGCHAEGGMNYISDKSCDGSHVEGGDNTLISGARVHIEGVLNFVSGSDPDRDDCIHAEGFCNTAQNQAEHAQGFYNLSNTGDTDDKKTLHSVGIGAKGARKNAHEIMRNGDQYIIGVGGYDGTNPETAKTIQEIINSGSSESNYALFNLEDFLTNEYIVGGLSEVIFSNVAEKVDSSTTNEINIENVRKLLDAYNNNKIILLKMTYAAQKTCIVQCQLSYYNSPFGKELLLNFGSNIYPSVNDDGSIVDHKVSILFRFDRINSLQNEAYYRGISCELNRKNDLFSSVLTGEGFYRYLGEMRLDKYSKAASYSELSPTDSLQQMIGKLDAKYGNKEDGGTGVIEKTLSPNVFYQFGEVRMLRLTLGNEIPGIYNEYMFQFTCGVIPVTLELPDDIKWLNGEAPTVDTIMPGKICQVSIVNKLAVIGVF